MTKNPFPPRGGSPLSSPRRKPGASRGHSVRIGIIGLGLIGGSIAEAFHDAGFEVVGWDPDPAVRLMAEEAGIGTREPWRSWVSYVDQVVLASPLAAVGDWIRQVVAEARRPLVLVDVSSVKMPLLPFYRQVLPPSCLLSLHPMAGKEVRGFAYRDGALFRGHPCLVVPWRDSPPEDLVRLWMDTLGTRPVTVPWDLHDPLMSLVSHVPYLISASVLALAQDSPAELAQWPEVAGTGFMDTTRIGASDMGLWQEILHSNHEAVRETFQRYADLINSWNQQIQQGGWPPALNSAPAARRRAWAAQGAAPSSPERNDAVHGIEPLP